MNWKLTSEELPPCELPVWLYDAEKKLGPYVGCRTDVAHGWLWARCYDSYWWDAPKNRWMAYTADENGDKPTHWMPLPNPPDSDLWIEQNQKEKCNENHRNGTPRTVRAVGWHDQAVGQGA